MPRCLNPGRFRWFDTDVPAHRGGSSGDEAQPIIRAASRKMPREAAQFKRCAS